MSLYKQKGSKNWWFEFDFEGRRIRQSTKTSSLKLARAAELQHRRMLELGYNGVAIRTPPKEFITAANEYLELKNPRLRPSTISIEKYGIQHLATVFKGRLIRDITAIDIKNYQVRRLAMGCAPNSVNLDIGTLRGILKRFKLWDPLQIDVAMLHDPKLHGHAMSKEEESRLLMSCSKSDSRILYPVVVLALCTGMRSEELRQLQCSQIDFKTSMLSVGLSKTKYGTGRQVPLNERVLETMKDWAAQFPSRQPHHFVFPAERGGAVDRDGIRHYHHQDPNHPIGSWRKAWEAARTRARVQIRFHDLRHTAVTRMLEQGAPLSVVSALVGWSPSTAILMSKRYAHIGNEALKKAVSYLK